MLLEEAAYKGTPLADYIYLDGKPVATLTPSGALYLLLDDMLDTPQLATDSSQNTAWQATYTPFGQASVSGTLTQNLRLPGQYYDFEDGWNHTMVSATTCPTWAATWSRTRLRCWGPRGFTIHNFFPICLNCTLGESALRT